MFCYHPTKATRPQEGRLPVEMDETFVCINFLKGLREKESLEGIDFGKQILSGRPHYKP